MRVAFHTLGCKVNQYETEAIKEAFVSRGAIIVEEDERADIYVINTCSVTNIADRKSRQFIRRAKKLDPNSIVVVTGCYAQTSPEEVKSMPEVDIVIGNSLKTEIAETACAMYADRAADKRTQISHVLSYDELIGYEDMGIVTSDESSMCRAYIKIEEGCNRFCSYCLIPYARGRVRSRAVDEIVKEAQRLIDGGYKEIILTGINTALYGSEPGFEVERRQGEEDMSGLEVLIKRVDALSGDFRIRLSSLEPTVVDISDVRKLLGYDKLCHHLHLSIQSGSDHVLRLMNRRYTVADYLNIVAALKEFDPDYGVTTDIIAGFPGETEEDHRETLKLIKQAGFGRVHAFRFSPRKGTKAETMPGQVDGNTKARRAAELSAAADESFVVFAKQNEGKTHKVLIEEINDGYAGGYTDNYIKVYVSDADGTLKQGDFCRVRLAGQYRDGCIAEKEAD